MECGLVVPRKQTATLKQLLRWMTEIRIMKSVCLSSPQMKSKHVWALMFPFLSDRVTADVVNPPPAAQQLSLRLETNDCELMDQWTLPQIQSYWWIVENWGCGLKEGDGGTGCVHSSGWIQKECNCGFLSLTDKNSAGSKSHHTEEWEVLSSSHPPRFPPGDVTVGLQFSKRSERNRVLESREVNTGPAFSCSSE